MVMKNKQKTKTLTESDTHKQCFILNSNLYRTVI